MAASTDAPLSATLLITSPDRKGLVAEVTAFIARHNGNILQLDQHVDTDTSTFFMRVVWDLTGFDIAQEQIDARFAEIGRRLDMTWELHFSDDVPRMAVFVSKEGHCLYDILSRVQSGEWRVEIPIIISNHPKWESVARSFDIPYHIFPITKDNKAEQEAKELALLKENKVDFIVLARYMQIISADFISHYPNKIINVHHSFLPAFIGRTPYQDAYARGVKIIGATSHYVTPELDQGPIIAQEIINVTHRDAVPDLIRKGKDNETVVLAKAIWHHLQHHILVHSNKTVIFG